MGNEAIVETIEKLGNELREFKGAYDKKLEELSKPKEVVVPPEAIKAAVNSYLKERAMGQPVPTAVDKETEKDVRMLCKALLDGDRMAAKALSEGTDNAGGYLVPDEFVARVDEMTLEYGLVRQFANVFNVSSKTINIPKLTDEPTVVWVSEGGVISTGQPKFGQTQITIKDAGIIVPITNDLLDDVAVPITEILGRIFARAFAKAEDYQAFNGDGSVFMGILNHPDVPVATMGTGDTAFTNLASTDLLDLNAAVHDAAEENSRYYMHRTVHNLVRKMTNGVTGPFLFPGNDIWGYPYSKTSLLSSIADSGANKKFMIFGDMSKLYFAKRKEISLQLSNQATVGTTNLYESNMVAIRVIERVGMAIAFPTAFATLKTAAA